jgi:hypothetical protein
VRYIDRINRAVTALATPKIGRSAAVAELAAKLEALNVDLKTATAQHRRAVRDQAHARASDSQKIAERRLAGKKGHDPLPTEPAAALAVDRAKLETEALSKAIDLASDDLGRAIDAEKADWAKRIRAEHESGLQEYAAAISAAKRAAGKLSESAPALAWLREFQIIPEHKPVGRHAALVSGRSFPGPESPTVRADFSATNARSDLRVSTLLGALTNVEFGKAAS